MSRPLLLDLFCGAGGAAMGYYRAGFDIIGVDVEPQPHYPFQFVRADAMRALEDMADGRRPWPGAPRPGAIHASPPCQDHSSLANLHASHGTGWMLKATVSRLIEAGLPFVVENVATAKFPSSVYQVQLCGSSFDLDVRRHRKFASDVLILGQACQHQRQAPRFRSPDRRQKVLASVVGVHGHLNYPGELELRRAAMGIDWMGTAELSQAIPPAYTEYIGRQLLEHVAAAAA